MHETIKFYMIVYEIHRSERDKGKNRSRQMEKFLYQSFEGKK
jgi:hypothetical protein